MWSLRRAPEGVADGLELATHVHPGAGRERAEAKGVVVEHGLRLGVGRQQDLEAAVDQEAVLPMRPHSPAHGVGGLQHDGLDAARGQGAGAREARQARANDHDGPVHRLPSW